MVSRALLIALPALLATPAPTTTTTTTNSHPLTPHPVSPSHKPHLKPISTHFKPPRPCARDS